MRSEILPRRFGRYLLFDRIGQGGMAEIFLARAATELGSARLVVVKQILPELAGDPAFARMLIAEAKLAAQLRNGNVVQVYDLGREADRLFIAMEYVEGFDLHALLRELSRTRTALPADFAIFVVREVLSALSYAHRAKAEDGSPLGLVHRDVSPSNVLISFEGEVKLCDFGIARALAVASVENAATVRARGNENEAGEESRADGARAVSTLAGKSAYMSPEHARGDAIDARADVFAAGILLWELCAGRRMYRGTEQVMLALARAGAVPPLPERGLPEPALLEAVLARALAPVVGDRFATAAEFQKALDDYAGKARLVASPLRFGAFLSENFGAAVVQRRRSRERGAQALELGPPAVLQPIGSTPETTADALPAAPTEVPGSSPSVPSAESQPSGASTARGANAPAIAWALAVVGIGAAAILAAWLAGWLGI